MFVTTYEVEEINDDRGFCKTCVDIKTVYLDGRITHSAGDVCYSSQSITTILTEIDSVAESKYLNYHKNLIEA